MIESIIVWNNLIEILLVIFNFEQRYRIFLEYPFNIIPGQIDVRYI